MINNLYVIRGFAQSYNDSAYGSCSYGQSTSCATTGTTTGGTAAGSSGSTLTNTGMIVSAVVAVACLVIFAALLVRFWRRPARVAVSDAVVHPASTTGDESATHHNDID